MNPQYESMTRVQLGRFTVRIWRTERENFSGYDNADIATWAKGGQVQGKAITASAKDMVNLVCDTFDRIAAVEVLDRLGNGLIKYTDWD